MQLPDKQRGYDKRVNSLECSSDKTYDFQQYRAIIEKEPGR